jgi:hypothetical protein
MTIEGNPFKHKASGEFAIRVALWLAKHDYGCALKETDDGVITITYAADYGEGHIYPSLHVQEGKVKWPAGSDLDLMLSFITQE